MEDNKQCSRCGAVKPVHLFEKNNKCKGGYCGVCRECRKVDRKKWTETHPEYRKQYNEANKEIIKEKRAVHHEINKEYDNRKNREYYQQNKETINARIREYQMENPDKVQQWQKNFRNSDEFRAKRAEIMRERRASDPLFKLEGNIRCRINDALKNNRKSDSTEKLMGCSIEYMKQYLEWQFDDKMTWENHGVYWHIDHITPISWFDLSDPEQQKDAFDYTNTQPLPITDNLSKGNRWAS